MPDALKIAICEDEPDQKNMLLKLLDESNIENIELFTDGKNKGEIKMLLEYAGEKREIKDPWFTGDFDTTYDDVVKGCKTLLKFIKENNLGY